METVPTQSAPQIIILIISHSLSDHLVQILFYFILSLACPSIIDSFPLLTSCHFVGIALSETIPLAACWGTDHVELQRFFGRKK